MSRNIKTEAEKALATKVEKRGTNSSMVYASESKEDKPSRATKRSALLYKMTTAKADCRRHLHNLAMSERGEEVA